MSLPLWSLEVSPLAWSLSFCVLTCPSLCGLQLVGDLHSVACFLAHRALAHPLAGCIGVSAPCQALPCSGLSCLIPALPYTPSSNASDCAAVGFLSPASRLNAGSALGHGKCSAYDRWCFFLFVYVNARGSDFPRICVAAFPLLYSGFFMSLAWLAPLFALQHSPSAGELFNSCAGTSIFDRAVRSAHAVSSESHQCQHLPDACPHAP